jgi:spore coat polysaccharide biosynthesis predicted glycosyltransferase SpsG
MNRSILIRIDNSEESGLGHISRSAEIGRILKLHDYQVFYALDRQWPKEFNSGSPNIGELLVLTASPKSHEKETIARFIKQYGIENLLVDSYKITEDWCKPFQKMGVRIFAIEDSSVSLQFLENVIPYGIRYLGTRQFPNLGEGSKAISNVIITAGVGELDIESIPGNSKRVFVYLGSNPSQQIFDQVLEGLLRCTRDSEMGLQLIFLRSNNISEDLVHSLISDSPISNRIKVTFVDFTPNIEGLIANCDLVIGAANTSIYYSSAGLIPQITFPLNSSQQNDDFQLEQLGHFFNLESIGDFQDTYFPSFFNSSLVNLPIYKSLLRAAGARPAMNGAQRIVDSIDAVISNRNSFHLPHTLTEVSEDVRGSAHAFRLRAATDSDVNIIYEGRNLDATRNFMINQKRISKPEHYAWWFDNARENYVGELGETASIYIWHQIREFEGTKFLIGGWTPLCSDLHLSVALEALRWQIKATSEQFPRVKWLAAVHKKNSATRFLVNRIGFKECDRNSFSYQAAEAIILGGDGDDDFVLYSS